MRMAAMSGPWVLSALPVQLPMPGCLPLIAAILMQKFPGSVKLTCPENQCHIMRRLENWKHEDLAATGYIYNLYHYICVAGAVLQTPLSLIGIKAIYV